MGNPTVTPIQEAWHAGGYVVYDPSDGQLTRSEITLLSGAGVCTAGLVLGQVAVAAATFAALGTNTGNPTCGTITVAAPAVAGVYVAAMVDATHFTVEDPAGVEVGHGVFGAAFAAGGLGFTLTAGGTPCIAGDAFKFTVAAGSGKYVPYDPTGNDGRQNARAILYTGYVDASSADKKAVANTSGPMKVNKGELVWGAGVTTTQHKTDALAALSALGIRASN